MTLKIKDFKVIELIGEGASSEVFRALDNKGNTVALKVIRQYLKHDDASKDRLHKEAQHLRKLKDERIVKNFGIQRSEDDRLVLISEFVEGKNIEQLIQLDKQRARPIAAVVIVSEILQGLQEAHRQKIVHRDLKPENILITSEGRVKITDFGVAKSLDLNKLTQTGVIVGSPFFMSPEQAMGKIIDQRSDLFSLGIILYYISTGHLPFIGDSYPEIIASLTNGFRPAEKVNKNIHPKLIKIINKALAKNADERYQKAYEFNFDLLKFLDELDLATPQEIIQAYFSQDIEKYEMQVKSLFYTVFNRAVSAYKKNNKELAINHLQHALAISPRNNDARLLLKKINTVSRKKLTLFILFLCMISAGVIKFYTSSVLIKSQAINTIISSTKKDIIIEVPKQDDDIVKEVNKKKEGILHKRKKVKRNPVKPKQTKAKFGRALFNIDRDVRVFLDGKEVFGMHSGPLKLKIGAYQLKMVKLGFPPIEGRIDVSENNTTTINAKVKK